MVFVVPSFKFTFRILAIGISFPTVVFDNSDSVDKKKTIHQQKQRAPSRATEWPISETITCHSVTSFAGQRNYEKTFSFQFSWRQKTNQRALSK